MRTKVRVKKTPARGTKLYGLDPAGGDEVLSDYHEVGLVAIAWRVSSHAFLLS